MYEDMIKQMRIMAALRSNSEAKWIDEAADALEMMQAWRDTVDDMLSVCHAVASDDPRESINRLIDWHVQMALDPAVSSDAQALIDRGVAAMQADAERYAFAKTLEGQIVTMDVLKNLGANWLDEKLDEAMKSS